LTSSFAVTNAIGQLGSGFLAERWGARRTMTGGIGLYATMNALIATAASAPWLLTWRSLAGFGGGAMLISERIYLAQVVAPARRAFSKGIISAAQSAGAVAGPAVGSVAAAIGGLRAPFVLVALTSAIAFVGTLFLRAPASDARRADDADAAPESQIPVRSLAILLVANIALLASYGAFITTYGPMATTRLDWSIVDVGIAFSFFGGGSILLGPWLSHLADRVGRRPVAVLAPIPVTAFAIGLVLGLPQPAVFAIAFLGGGGLTAFSASWYALLADTAGERRLSRTFGIISAASTIGIVIGALGASQLWERVDIAAGMLLAALLPLVTSAAMLAFRPRALPLPA
jgi:MFS family permease